MRKSRFTEEQITGVLKAAQAGQKIADLRRKHVISEHTFYRSRAKYVPEVCVETLSSVRLPHAEGVPGETRGRTAQNLHG